MPSRYDRVKCGYRDAVVAATSNASHFLSTWSQQGDRLAAEADPQPVGICSPRQGLSKFSDKWEVLLETVGGMKGVPQA